MGCIYIAQGFEFDYIGVIIGPDLVCDPSTGSLATDIYDTRDPVLRRDRDHFDEYVRNIYRVLLSRGIKGCCVYFVDKKEAVKRTIARFPDDFMFQLTKEEYDKLLFQIGRSSWGGRRTPPNASSEQGVAMLSGVLKSERALKVNIQIMRVFTRMREMLEIHKEILIELEHLERKDIEQDEKILLIFEYLKQLEQTKQQELDQQNRKRIGYKRKNEWYSPQNKIPASERH